jgi:ABC-2 type transport system ATP-binding protein
MIEPVSHLPAVLSVHNLTKRFQEGKSDFLAVNEVSFDIKKGEIVGLLGPNGAGKTTTIQMLLGLMTPTSGDIKYFGKSFEKHREEVLQKINHTSGYARFPWRLTVWENLNVFGHMYGIANREQKIDELGEIFEATNLFKKRFQDLSAGQMTRVLLMKAFINEPELVLLDEPTASLDPDISDKIREYILAQQKKREMSILITSHNMKEVEQMCDRVVFLNRGKVYAIDTPQGLDRRNKYCELQLMVDDGLKRLIEVIDSHSYPFEVKQRYISITLPEEKVGTFLSEMGSRGLQYSEIEIVRPSLEDSFLSVSEKRTVKETV